MALPAQIWYPVGLGCVANWDHRGNAWQGHSWLNLPTGQVTLGGVPFLVSTELLASWNPNSLPSGQPRVATLSVDLPPGVMEVHTLMNTGWGRVDAPYAAVEFVGSAGTRFVFPLLGNEHIRDWLQSNYTNNINGTTTTEVWSEGNARLDKQRFSLPPVFLTERLSGIIFHDWGSPLSQTLYVVGVSALSTAAMPGRGPTSLGGGCQGGGTQAIGGLFCLGMGLRFSLGGVDPGASLAVLNVGALGFGLSCGPCNALSLSATWAPALRNGAADITIQVPCLRSLVGLPIGAQWLVLGTSSSPCPAFPGVAVSDAAMFTLGL